MATRRVKSPIGSWPLNFAAGLCLLGAIAGGLHAAEPTPTASPDATVSDPQDIANWVRQLDDDRFAVREAAHYKLVASGAAALDAVGHVASDGSLESSTRAVSILLQWAEGDDNVLSLGALEWLAGLVNRPVEAAMAADRLADVREMAALQRIVDLGGRVAYDPLAAFAPGPDTPIQVVIGPKWKGGLEGLSQIAAVRHATTVSFYEAPIGEQAIPALSKLLHVQRIEFYGTEISEEGLNQLAEALPKVIVEVRSGARLGIQGSKTAGVAMVDNVQTGSAAERAGLLPGDIILEISGVAVTDFQSLTQEIAKAKPGDSVVLKVHRQGAPQQQPFDVTVTFDHWGEESAANPAVPTEANPFGAVPLGVPPRPTVNRR
jgi:hypothetical protein